MKKVFKGNYPILTILMYPYIIIGKIDIISIFQDLEERT
jgi:hypothetical protein